MNEELMDGKDRLLEENKKLQQENTQLKQMVNSPSITFTTCPECGKNYSINYCREVHNLKQQLKDKDDKISKVISFSKSQINIIKQQPSNDTSVDNYFIEKLLSIIATLETNKED